MKLTDKLAISVGLKAAPRRRGLGKKNPLRIAAEQENGERRIAISHDPTTAAAIRLSRRDYKAVVGVGGINSDWALNGLSEDADVWQNNFALRSRSRDLWRTDCYFTKYTEEMWANVFGSEGITCRMRIKETEDRVIYSPDESRFRAARAARMERMGAFLERKYGTRAFRDRQATIKVGDLDIYANKVIEEAWAKWKRREYCTVTGALSYNEVCQLRLLSCARDGDYFIRHVKQPTINDFGYSLQLINSEWCDYSLNTKLDNGNEIRMGIERDQWGKRINYYFIRRSPMDWQFGSPGFGSTQGPKNYSIVPAEQIIHYARYKDGDSTRPAPWSASVIQKSRHLDKYEEAEVVAARVSACKLGFFTSNQVPEGGEAMGDRPDPTQEATMDAEPGSFTGLKWGIDFKEWNPEHPNGNFDLFRKGMLRAWCAGLPGANYNIIANDLEGVNYSSGRLGMLDERELWKLIQKFDIEIAERPIFENWLEMALMTGAIPLPLAKFDKFNKPIFRGRRWAWVDPLKEVQASALQVANKFTSRTRIIEDSDVDGDFEQIIFELAEEEMMLEELGLSSQMETGKPPQGGQPTQQPDSTDNQTADNADGSAKALTEEHLRYFLELSKPQPAPPLTINNNFAKEDPPIVNVAAPVVNVPEQKMPEQKAPVVHVAAAKISIPPMQPPEVVVNVAAPSVTVKNDVKIPTTKKLVVTRRDDNGKMEEVTVEKQ